MIEAGDITMLAQCFRIIPKTTVAEDLGEHKGRFSERMNRLELIAYGEMKKLSKLFDIEVDKLASLIIRQDHFNDEGKMPAGNNKKESI